MHIPQHIMLFSDFTCLLGNTSLETYRTLAAITFQLMTRAETKEPNSLISITTKQKKHKSKNKQCSANNLQSLKILYMCKPSRSDNIFDSLKQLI